VAREPLATFGRRYLSDAWSTVVPVIFDSYIPAIQSMRNSLRFGPTEEQKRLAKMFGVRISEDEPRTVIAAKLRDVVLPLVDGQASAEVPSMTERQTKLLCELDQSPKDGMSKSIAFAWIDYYFTLRNMDALASLRLTRGDRVTKTHELIDPDGVRSSWEEEYVVSSIRSDGFLYLKGGNNNCGWPHQFRRVLWTNAEG
jgi:hypothetical protein